MPPNLKTLLRKANLPVEVVEKPSEVSPRLRDDADRGAFLMDIRREKGEILVVRPGRAEVQVEDAATLRSIERAVGEEGIPRKTALGAHLGRRRGRPHIADERVLVVRRRRADVEDLKRQLASLPEGARGLWVRDANGLRRHVRRASDIPPYLFDRSLEYARGVVRHPDRRPRKLDGWHLVTSNAEPRQAGPVVEGMTWVD